MQINTLKLKNFRNHINRKFEFDNKLTLILGQNGSGKTNILEAIYVLATGKSQRARYDKDLINYAHTFCSIEANVLNQEDKFDLEMQILKRDNESNFSAKRTKVNKVVKSISAFTGTLNAVSFMPEDIAIITGAPSERRRFLDLLLSQTDHTYKRSHSAFNKAVRQRNSLLELINEEGRGYSQLGFWNEQVMQYGTYLCNKRKEFIDYANDTLGGLLHDLDSGKRSAVIDYKQSEITPERLEKYREREIAAKSTLIGPHREDFEISYNDYNIAEFGSRGQQRTTLLSLKLIEIAFIEKTKGERPVLLLDDIFSELDAKHREAVFNIIDKQQTIISSAETEVIEKHSTAAVINI